MIQPIQSLEAALAQVDRSSFEAQFERAEAERRELQQRFPRARWPEMTLEEFAIGHDRSEDSFCWWMEFKALTIGSIRGGSAQKLIIYKHRNQPGWFFPKGFEDEQAAWRRLRQDFVHAFELAEAGKWDEIDELELLSYGPALKLKTLHLYFPAAILPVYSSEHLRRYLRLVKGPQVVPPSAPVGLNRALLAALRERSELADWPTQTLMEFLYSWSDPREAKRVYKIAPGEEARYWPDSLDNGYICVGWDDVGDLREFPSKEEFKAAFRECYADKYRDHQSKITEKANEVWKLMELEPGDLVVANKGISQVLAVGEVVEPGYVYRNERTEYKHTVAVRWDTSFAKAIPAQKRWQFVTVAKIPDALVETILGHVRGRVVPVDPLYLRIANGLERKGQVILYGPPGTGKTYAARRFAVWWLLRQSRDPGADLVLANTERFRAAEERLSEAAVGSVSQLTRVTFHPSYTYEDFVEGFRPVDTEDGGLSLRLQDGVFKRVCREAKAEPDLPFLILVDEINRGHVAKILGELLTFLERDKRGLTVLLPQSKETFSIPPNVYLLGTMNTADRSIKLLDAALRRRFAFLELMPDVDLLRGAAVGELALDDFLEELNRRIARNEGREKQIGHAYLLDRGQPVSDVEEFASRFREEILPLLQEYCYEDYATLARYIGTELVDVDSGVLHHSSLDDPERLVTALAKELASGPSGEE